MRNCANAIKHMGPPHLTERASNAELTQTTKTSLVVQLVRLTGLAEYTLRTKTSNSHAGASPN
eukprot:10724227-Lingulodinium_polyedra.AAC.1